MRPTLPAAIQESEDGYSLLHHINDELQRANALLRENEAATPVAGAPASAETAPPVVMSHIYICRFGACLRI